MRRIFLPAQVQQELRTALPSEAQAPALADLTLSKKADLAVVLVSDASTAERLLAELPTLLAWLAPDQPAPEMLWLPPAIEWNEDTATQAQEAELDRLATLTRLSDPAGAARRVLLTTPAAFWEPCAPRQELTAEALHLRVGDAVDFRALIERLPAQLGYDNEAVCEQPGQFAVRGGLIDVYPLNADAPVRIDFFGDEIETLRRFDPTTQRSLDALTEVRIAARGTLSGPVEARDPRGIFSYLPASIHWLLLEPDRLRETHRHWLEEMERGPTPYPTLAALWQERDPTQDHWSGLTVQDDAGVVFGPETPTQPAVWESLEAYRSWPWETALGADRVAAEEEARADFLAQVRAWQQDGAAVTFFVPTEAEIARWQEMLADSLWGDAPAAFQVGELSRGFRWQSDQGSRVAVTPREFLGRQLASLSRRAGRKVVAPVSVDQALNFNELVEGDPVVHLAHGICLYQGLSRMQLGEREEAVISLEFADRITLHLPLHEAHLLTRYVGLTKQPPKLAKLGGQSWVKARRAAEKATVDFAAQLLQQQAQREEAGGHACGPDTAWQRAFEGAFPHRETPDQLRAITEAKHDLEQPRAMDRLLCGDVGFGKTEVALRIAFKAVMEGQQVAILVPTTVLAQQHFNTFCTRLAEYPVTVEMLSRFRSKAEQTAILKQVAGGQIDILIGTHRIISQDVHFRRLGLLVIDEEHRFGVRHKEQLKRLKINVDVLAMSATPIPRTLYLALMGARDLSVIETAPQDRRPIETIVKGYDPEVIRRAIAYELGRGGQVFYLHNRVQSIEAVAQRLQELSPPKTRILVGHGQMTEHRLEKVMTDFVAGKADILVCTTIIENGIDIPNCNTLIIEGADRFGLSQLYQLRGRVGRFNRQAYAYLLLHRHAQVLNLARERLNAMRQYNQLGAGFKIALRDLELRGAGNLLGAQQSGHIAAVGFDLYCQLLRASVNRLKGQPEAAHIRAQVELDFVQLGVGDSGTRAGDDRAFVVLEQAERSDQPVRTVVAELPERYINETRLRVDLYRRLALAETLEAVQALEDEMLDRFGKMPPAVKYFLALTRIRVRAESKGIRSVRTEGDRLKCRRATRQTDDYVKLGSRFPRLTRRGATARLQEIESFLHRLDSP